MLDRAFTLTARNLSTLFLALMVVALPLHLVYAAGFANVIEVAELHDQIEDFTGDERVRGVGPVELERYRLVGAALGIVQIALLPLLVAGAREVVSIDREGGVPTVAAFWGAATRRRAGPPATVRHDRGWAATVAGAVLFAVALGVVLHRALLLATAVLDPPVSFVGVALAESAARSAAAPWALVAATLSHDD